MKINGFRLINFIEMDQSEIEMVLKWRNSKVVRRNMFDTKKITLKHHISFIDKLKTDKDKLYFLVYENKDPIGVIYIKKNIDIAEFGIYLNPNKIGKGYGLKLSKIEIDLCFNVLNVSIIHLYVLDNNKAAVELYKKIGFEVVDIKKKLDKKFIKMELDKYKYKNV